MEAPFEFNPLSPEFQANPYPYYEMLRENAPIFYFAPGNMWFLAHYEDVNAVFKDPRFGREIFKVISREAMGIPEDPPHMRAFNEVVATWMLEKDPPDHTRLRTLVHKAFTPRMIERLRERAQAITDDLIDKAQAQGGMDLIDEFALLLPVTVIAEMLGVPPGDYPVLRQWSTALARFVEIARPPEVQANASQAIVEFSAYLREMIAERRKNPQEDLISALIVAEAEGDKLSELEMVGMCTLLLFAGHETTVNLIGNGILALLQHPDQWEKLKANPALVKTATEELLRYDSPLQITARWVLEDCEFNGYSFKCGQLLIPMIGSANRDPARFTNPTDLDITRDPNPHIAFASGIHHCLGAPLARMEGQIAFAALANRLPNLKLVDEPRRRDTYVLRGFVEMPVTF